ncbi:MAG: dethiobiotin synthase [Bacteroidota bacterium]|nr:dethiobiotin synthase [Bacteroidota bacterium]
MTNLFVTGISTDVGKTIASSILVQALRADYWKPIQSGNLDFSDAHSIAHYLQDNSIVIHPHAYALEKPMSPHAAAELENLQINLKNIKRPTTKNKLVIEGAGGLLVPLNHKDTIVDLIHNDDLIVLVSKNYLGSINHTLMSIEILKSRGFKKIVLLFNGKKNKSTQDIILQKSGLPTLGRLEQHDRITPKIIQQYAHNIKPKLLSIL